MTGPGGPQDKYEVRKSGHEQRVKQGSKRVVASLVYFCKVTLTLMSRVDEVFQISMLVDYVIIFLSVTSDRETFVTLSQQEETFTRC